MRKASSSERCDAGRGRGAGSSTIRPARGVAQPGSALRSGRRGPQFESGHPDGHTSRRTLTGEPVPRDARAAPPRSRFLEPSCISDRAGRESDGSRCGSPWLVARGFPRLLRRGVGRSGADPRRRRRRPEVDRGHEGRRPQPPGGRASRRSGSRCSGSPGQTKLDDDGRTLHAPRAGRREARPSRRGRRLRRRGRRRRSRPSRARSTAPTSSTRSRARRTSTTS